MTEDKTDVDSLVVALLRADKIVRQMAGDGVMFDFEAPPTALELEAADLITRLTRERDEAIEALRPFAEADSGRVALEVRTIDVSRARALTTGDAT